MKKVLVIGSNSFSGSDFIDFLLERGEYQVIGVSRSDEKVHYLLPYKKRDLKNFSFYKIDINSDLERLEKIIDESQVEYIVNFAAQSEVAPSWENPHHWFQTNGVAITKLANILKNKRFLKKYVHISSPEVYGTCEGVVKEDAPLNPSTPYAASKAAGDLSLFTFYKNFELPLILIRATNVYGPYQQLFKIIPRSIIFLKLNKLIELHGGGSAIKSYIHIRDVSRGEWMAMEKGKAGEIYHFSPDQGISVRDVVNNICCKLSIPFSSSVKVVTERLGQDKAYVIDSTKARRELQWAPEINFEKGIDSTLKWIDDNFNEISQHPLHYIHKA